MLKKLALVFSLLFLVSCSEPTPKLKVSATTWIGYSPLFYAKEKGWLDELNIKLLHVVSLSENMYLFQAGNADAYVGTQYEYQVMSKNDASLMPVMLFDRSYGGDVVMSNVPLLDIRSSDEPVDVYLEMDSINYLIFKDFIEAKGLQAKKFNFINQDQASIASLSSELMERAALVVTYAPYDIELVKRGFSTLASTRNGLELFVVDGLFTHSDVFEQHRSQFEGLKKLVDQAIEDLEQDPQAFYQVVKPYLLEVDFKEFEQSLNNIVWVNQDVPPEMEQRMRKAGFPTRGLMQ